MKTMLEAEQALRDYMTQLSEQVLESNNKDDCKALASQLARLANRITELSEMFQGRLCAKAFKE